MEGRSGGVNGQTVEEVARGPFEEVVFELRC